LSGTVRTLDPEVHQRIPEIIERICRNTGATFGAGVSLEYQRMIPPLVNSPEMAERVAESCTTLLGPNAVVEPPASMAGEDFALFLEEVPGAYFFLGAGRQASEEVHGLHSDRFEIDERALPIGAALLAHTALSTLETFGRA
jgi:metal-dependent amidase/aminoacylase/carboxypeptidase family protein